MKYKTNTLRKYAIFIIHVDVSFNRADDLNYCQVIAVVNRSEEVSRIMFLISFTRYNFNSINKLASSKIESRGEVD